MTRPATEAPRAASLKDQRESDDRICPDDVVDIALIVEAGAWPPADRLETLAERVIGATVAELALAADGEPAELSLVFTDDEAIRRLNASWRGKDKATNVLSFPSMPLRPGSPLPAMLGDIVIAGETVGREAAEEEKPFDHHLSHLIVHGFLHLLGYDHEVEADAEAMERTERRVLARLAIPDPYA